MKEKQPIKISLSTFFLILAIIVILVMGYFIYKLYNEKSIAEQEITDLTDEVSNLENTVNTFQEKIDNISNTINSNTSNNVSNNNTSSEQVTSAQVTEKNPSISNTPVTRIEGEYWPKLESANDAPGYVFFSDGTVELRGNFTQFGTYEINNNIIKSTFTRQSGPDGENEKINEVYQLTIVDSKTLLDTEYNTKYVKDN